jgi:tRNA-specific 2-thiouridylase
VTLDGRVLGRHRGLIRYTLGQRKGLGLALPAPLYVCGLDLAENRVLLGEEQTLYTKTLLAHDLNLITAARWEEPQRLSARVRYRQKEQPATVTLIDEDTLLVEFDEPQRAITRGQAVVLYDGDVVAGGGVIA